MSEAGPTQPGGGRGAAQVKSRRIAFRPDIEGIRAAALFLALAAHGGVTWMSGGFVGVDIFFVLSGYLITGLLLAEAQKSGSVALGNFYAHRMKRLLPLAVLVLIVTVIGSMLLFSPARREVVSGDVLTAALHVVNWHFAAQSVDYFGPESAASPIMHYWSLSIEEQFYLVWALVLAGVAWAWQRSGRRIPIRRLLLSLVVVVFALSLIYSIRYSAEAPSAAYFSTLTRAWQIACGALLALIVLPRISASWSWILTIGGIAAIAYSVIAFDATTNYPGSAALIPVLGTAALIVAGTSATRSAPRRLLETPAFVYVGGLSYAWYLWHYPVMIFGLAAWGPLEVSETTFLVFAAGIPAAISHHLIGQPLRYSTTLTRFPRRAVAVGSACTVAAVVAALALTATVPSLATAPESEVAGASKLAPPTLQSSADAVRPAPTAKAARGDRGNVWEDGCMVQPFDTESGECVFGREGGRKTVVLFGDSHAMHLFATVERLAEERNWRLVSLTKAGCPPYQATFYNGKVEREYRECTEWQQHALERIEEERPQILFTSGALSVRVMEEGRLLDGARNDAALEEGYVRMLEELKERAPQARMIGMKDLPVAPHDMTDCVSENLDDLRKCAFEKGDEHRDSPDRRAIEAVDGVELVDLSPAICDKGTCYGVIGNALVYRDNDHLTATFARTLAPWLGRELDRPNR
jgi:peptidoglycan/LPS O-acetylase OafA/YrhL